MFRFLRHNDGLYTQQTCCKRKKLRQRKRKTLRCFFFFYLQAVILGSGFPEHGDGGCSQSGCRAAAEGVNVTRWMERRRAEGAERSELV